MEIHPSIDTAPKLSNTCKNSCKYILRLPFNQLQVAHFYKHNNWTIMSQQRLTVVLIPLLNPGLAGDVSSIKRCQL